MQHKEYKTTINIPIYEEPLVIIFTSNLNKSLAKLKEPPMEAAGVIIDKEDRLIILFPINFFNYQVAVHESYHAMRNILNSRDIHEEETEAYLIDFIFGSIEKQYLKIKDKFN